MDNYYRVYLLGATYSVAKSSKTKQISSLVLFYVLYKYIFLQLYIDNKIIRILM